MYYVNLICCINSIFSSPFQIFPGSIMFYGAKMKALNTKWTMRAADEVASRPLPLKKKTSRLCFTNSFVKPLVIEECKGVRLL